MMVYNKSILFCAICLVLVAGCDNLAPTANKKVANGPKPFAVLSIAPIQDWYSEAVAISEGHDANPISEKAMRAILPGVDAKQPAAAMLYMSEKLVPEPVLLLPVSNYRRFLSGLHKRFGLKQAAASSFNLGPYKILVKENDGYAVLGTSISGINQCPAFPRSDVSEMPDGSDFVLMLDTKSVKRSEGKNIAKAIENSLGESMAQIIKSNESFVMGVSLDSTKELGFETKLTPLPNDSDEAIKSLGSWFEAQGLVASTNVNDDCLICNVKLPSTQFDTAWTQTQPVLRNAFQNHLKVLENRATGSNSNKFSMKITYEKSIGCSSNSGGGGVGGGGGRRRS